MKLLLLSLCVLVALVAADLPVTCFGEQVFGCSDSKQCTWQFTLSSPRSTPKDCSNEFLVNDRMNLVFEYPNIVSMGSNPSIKGTWVIVYNQGLEVRIAGYSFFFFFDYEVVDKKTISHCDRTIKGWYHNVDKTEFGCMKAVRLTYAPPLPDIVENDPFTALDDSLQVPITYTTAPFPYEVYPNGKKVVRKVVPQDINNIFFDESAHPNDLPKEVNWVERGFVPETRNQGACGSCYSFAFTGALASRVRIQSDNKLKPDFANQHMVDCSFYSQGCNGGFITELGRYTFETGIVEQEHYPYEAKTNQCKNTDGVKHWKVKDYYFVNGYYGNSTGAEQAIMRELAERGPVPISIMVPPGRSFRDYKSGVYMYNEQEFARFGWFVEVNHAVLAVGYGVENGVKYWLIQNSWGTTWGDNGFFKIVRGIDNLGIESCVEGMIPDLD
ncbi:hypothetical protein RCL1_004089 [Eukaryota sp. TZLM3-RCL]